MKSYCPQVLSQSLTAKATALVGSCSAILGFDIIPSQIHPSNLLGFAINRFHTASGATEWLCSEKRFRRDLQIADQVVASNLAPVQQFRYGDYSLKPDTEYLYRVYPVVGMPDQLLLSPPVILEVVTTSNRSGETEIYFNLGTGPVPDPHGQSSLTSSDQITNQVVGSQSHGLEAAVLGFVDGAHRGDALKLVVSDFDHAPVIDALRRAVSRGVHVRIVYDAQTASGYECTRSQHVHSLKLPANHITARRRMPHLRYCNFIVHSSKRMPLRVWVGSAAFTTVGLNLQTNLGMVFYQSSITRRFDQFFRLLQLDLPFAQMREQVAQLTVSHRASSDPDHRVFFAPVKDIKLLKVAWGMAWQTQEMALVSFPRGVDRSILDALRDNPNEVLTYGIARRLPTTALELIDRTVYATQQVPALGTALDGSQMIRNCEVSPNLMIGDPWAKRPRVLASFGDLRAESQRKSDAHAIWIERDPRVAAILGTELMHLYELYKHAVLSEQTKRNPALDYLVENGSWTLDYYNPFTAQFRERIAFAGVWSSNHIQGQ